jgi:5'(3')-deoxyribonucleotidase
MAAQPPSLHAVLRLGGVPVAADTHLIVAADEVTAREPTLLLSAALAQLHPHAARFVLLTAQEFLAVFDSNKNIIPIVIGRDEALLRALGWTEQAATALEQPSSVVPPPAADDASAVGSSAAVATITSTPIDWSVSTPPLPLLPDSDDVRLGLLFLGGGANPQEQARNLAAAVLWFAKEVVACDLGKLLASAAATTASAASAAPSLPGESPRANAQMNLARLNVRWSFPSAALRAELGLVPSGAGEINHNTAVQQLAEYIDKLELLLNGENSELGMDLSKVPVSSSPQSSPAAASAAAASAVSPSLPSPSPSPSPSATTYEEALPSVLDPTYVAPAHKRPALQTLLGGAMEADASSSDAAASALPKPLIAVDLDEVLGDFVPQLVKFYNTTYTATGTHPEPGMRVLTNDDFFSYAFHEVWGGTAAESATKVDAFFESSYFADIPVVAGAREALESLRSKFDFTVVTSRQHHLEPRTRAWLSRHYPGIFKGVFFGNHWASSGVKQSKPDMCAAIGAVALIDDSVTYALQCSHVLPRVFLFGTYAWNKLPAAIKSLPANVLRSNDWETVRRELEAWTPPAPAQQQPSGAANA